MGKIAHAVTASGDDLYSSDWVSNSSHTIDGTGDLDVVRSASLVVAASDATALELAQADYICDGTADDVQINAAADALTSGGKIQLTTGTYVCTDNVFDTDTPNGITLAGMGDSTILSFTANYKKLWIEGYATPKRNFVIRDLKLDGNNVGVLTTLGSLIYIRGDCSNILIENVYAINAKVDGLEMGPWTDGSTVPTRITVRNFRATNCCRCGLVVAGGQWITLENIECWANNIDEVVAEIDLEPGPTSTMRDIICRNIYVHDGTQKGFAIFTYANRTNQRNIMVDGLVAYNIANANISLGCPTDVTINNFYLYSGGVANGGIACARDAIGVKISNGTIHTIGNRGINFIMSSETKDSDKITIDNVDIYGCLAGISINTGVTYTIKRLNIKNNFLHDNTNYGIEDPKYLAVIEGNTFWGNGIVPLYGGLRVRNNTGYVTEKAGTATLVNGTTSIAFNHGLSATPVAGDIMVTPIEAWGAMTEFRIDTYTSTQATITADQNPGQDVDFAWRANRWL